jgi:hypothetical protein
MPRETVPNQPGDQQFQVKVGWQKDMHMQVGIETPEGPAGQHHLVDYFYGQPAVLAQIGTALANAIHDEDHELNAALFALREARESDTDQAARQHVGRQVLDIVTGSGEGPSTGLWWTPTRFQVNSLIRLLRKARDAAYGRDE